MRAIVDDCDGAMDTCDKFVHQFTARMQIWLYLLSNMVHKMIVATSADILFSNYFVEFEITYKSSVIRQTDLTLMNSELIEKELRTQTGVRPLC